MNVFKSILLATGLLLAAGFAPSDGTCDKALLKIAGFYKQCYNYEKLYMKYSMQIVENGEVGEKLSTEWWSSTDKIRMENEFMYTFIDEKTEVMVLKDSRTVLLKNATPNKIIQLPDVNTQLDSLKKLANKINCIKKEDAGELTLEFLPKINGKNCPYKRIVYTYSSGNGSVQKVEYEYYTAGGSKKDIYEYHKVSSSFSDDILKGSALEKVLVGNKLRSEYAGYTLRDLRKEK